MDRAGTPFPPPATLHRPAGSAILQGAGHDRPGVLHRCSLRGRAAQQLQRSPSSSDKHVVVILSCPLGKFVQLLDNGPTRSAAPRPDRQIPRCQFPRRSVLSTVIMASLSPKKKASPKKVGRWS